MNRRRRQTLTAAMAAAILAAIIAAQSPAHAQGILPGLTAWREAQAVDIVFQDNFETGDFSKWDHFSERFSIQTNVVYEGTYAAQQDKSVADTSRRLFVALPVSLTEFRYTIYFRVTSTSATSTFLVNDSEGSGGVLYALVARNGTFQYYDGAAYHALPTGTSYTANQWYKCVVEGYAGSNTLKYWIDDGYKGAHQNIEFDQLDHAQIGLASAQYSPSYSYFDKIMVENLQHAEPLAE